jgi:peptidoglycan/LPS O-acetylase OafA/YrhL
MVARAFAADTRNVEASRLVNDGFDPNLESLRGLAALAVAVAHAFAMFRVDGSYWLWSIPFLHQTPMQKLFMGVTAVLNPDFAVVLFFVLSGYVLTSSLERGVRGRSYLSLFGAYYIRRAFRLFPPMWFSILLCATAYYFIHIDAPSITPFFRSMAVPPSLAAVVGNIFLISFGVNSVTWTMSVEVVGSVLLPVFWLVSRSSGAKGSFAVFVILVFTALVFRHYNFRYVPCFQVGLLLALFPKLREPGKNGLGVVVTVLLLTGLSRLFSSHWAILLVANTLAAYLLIAALSVGSIERLGSLLRVSLIRILGRVSYSFYLFHLLVFIVVLSLAERLPVVSFPPLWSTFIVGGVGLIASAIVAVVVYEFIEIPSIRIGKRLASAISCPSARALSANPADPVDTPKGAS